MHKFWFPKHTVAAGRLIAIWLLAVVLLSACSQTTVAPTAAKDELQTATRAAAPAPTATSTEPAAPTQTQKKASAVEMQCRVVSSVPTPEPSELSKFPPPGADDWTLGKESAAMTVIEYSDYQ